MACLTMWISEYCWKLKLMKLFCQPSTTQLPLQTTMNIAQFPSPQFSYLVDILQFSSDRVIFQFHPLFIHQRNANISQQVSFHLIYCRILLPFQNFLGNLLKVIIRRHSLTSLWAPDYIHRITRNRKLLR